MRWRAIAVAALITVSHGALAGTQSAEAQTISTVAGGGVGDGAAATQGALDAPAGVCGDAAGNVYIADARAHRIRIVDKAGIISTAAGTGVAGFSGDGGPAAQAMLSAPQDVFVDADGTLYIADSGNNRIRKVDAAGIITTVAGTGVAGFSGDGGPAVQADLKAPTGVFVDLGGALYIADGYNSRIRKVDSSGTIITVAGTGVAGFSGDGGPANLAQIRPQGGRIHGDAAGALYIADSGNRRVRRIGADGVITTVAGTGTAGNAGDGGLATEAQFKAPSAVFVDPAGNVLICDAGDRRVRRVDPAGVITAFAGTGKSGYSGDGEPATEAQLTSASAAYADAAGNVYIADLAGHRVRRVDASGIISTMAGTGEALFGGDGGQAAQAILSGTMAVAGDRAGNLYVTVWANNRVRKIGRDGVISTVAGNGQAGFAGDGGPATQAKLNSPSGICLDAAGNVYIADGSNQRVRKLDPSGTITTVAGTGAAGGTGDGGPATQATLDSPVWVAVDASGNLYISEYTGNRVRKVDPAGLITTVAGTGVAGYSGDGGSATLATLHWPVGILPDRAGNLYIADEQNHCVRKVDPAGTITTVAGTGAGGYSGDGGPATAAQLNGPGGLCMDGAGNLYIAEQWNHRVRRVDTQGIITTVVGTGSAGFAGDGGPAVEAQINWPVGLYMDAPGNLLIAEQMNERVRRVQGLGTATVVQESFRPALPQAVMLFRGYPNPFNSSTSIGFALPVAGHVEMAVFNLAGQRVATLVRGTRPAGSYQLLWDGTDDGGNRLASGVYVYRLQADHQELSHKLLLLQ